MIVRDSVGLNEIFPGYLGQETAPSVPPNSYATFYEAVENGFNVAKTALEQAKKGESGTAKTLLNDPKTGYVYWNAEAWRLLKGLRDSGYFSKDDSSEIALTVMRSLGDAGAMVSDAIAHGGSWLRRIYDTVSNLFVKLVSDTVGFWGVRWRISITAYRTIVKVNQSTAEGINKLKLGLKDDPELLASLSKIEAAHAKFLAYQNEIEAAAIKVGISTEVLKKEAGLQGLGAAPLVLPATAAGVAGLALLTVWKFCEVAVGAIGAAIFFTLGTEGHFPAWMEPRYKVTLRLIEETRRAEIARQSVANEAELAQKIKANEWRNAALRGFDRSKDVLSDFALVSVDKTPRDIQNLAELEENRAAAAEKAGLDAYRAGKSPEEIWNAGNQAFLAHEPTSALPYIVGFGLAGAALALIIRYYTKGR